MTPTKAAELRADVAGLLGLVEDHRQASREAAAAYRVLEAERDVLLKEKHTLTHQVICCGVAATHPDPLLTTRGAYAGRWNSNQAESVRQLRAERDALRADSERWRSLYARAINEANGLTNYVEDRPELRRAEKQLEAIQREARAIDAAMKGTK